MPQAFARLGSNSVTSRFAKVRQASQRGFTLIEVMVVVAIIGILSAIAIPSYTDYIIRSNLVDATNALSDMRTKMEQKYADNRSYANAAGACAQAMPVLDNFTLACTTPAGGQTYSITATGTAGRSVAGFVYTINQQNAKSTTFGPAWGSIVPTGGATRWVMKK